MTEQTDLTGLLRAWSEGDGEALALLAPLVHQELRELARRILAEERRDGRWRPTELIQESYLRLLDWRAVRWQNRAHFFAATARMMRRVLVDAASARRRLKRGEGIDPVPLDGVDVAASDPHADLLALEDALDALSAVNTRASQVVELRFFGGFTVEETAEALGVSVRTVINDWNAARAWLLHELTEKGHGTLVPEEPRLSAGHVMRTYPLIALKRYEAAIQSCDQALELNRNVAGPGNPHSLTVALRGYALARLGRTAEAESVLARLRSRAGEQYVPPHHEALLLHALGRDEEALARLRDAVDSRHLFVTFVGVDPEWDDLRDVPEFRTLMARANLLDVSDQARR